MSATLRARTTVLANGESASVLGLTVDAIPAYNQFHPQGRDNGYVVTIGGVRLYMSGDTEDVAEMRANGLALGGSSGENAVVFAGDQVVSPGGLRHDDEPVRHKMLDALGDLALAGAPLMGRYTGVRAGHALTNTLLRKLFATPNAVRMIVCTPAQAAQLPGAGLIWDEIPAVA